MLDMAAFFTLLPCYSNKIILLFNTMVHTRNLQILIVLIGMFLLNHVEAQDTSSLTQKIHLSISISALYDFPQSFGALAGIDFPLKHITTLKEKKNGDVVEKNKELI